MAKEINHGSGDVNVYKKRTLGALYPDDCVYCASNPNRRDAFGESFTETTYEKLESLASDIANVFAYNEPIRVTSRGSIDEYSKMIVISPDGKSQEQFELLSSEDMARLGKLISTQREKRLESKVKPNTQ